MSSTDSRLGLPALSAAQLLIAGALAETADVTVGALAEATKVSKSTVAKALAKLEQAGAARRTRHEDGDVRLADTWSPTVLMGELRATATDAAPKSAHAVAVASADIGGLTLATSEGPEVEAGSGANETGTSFFEHVLGAGESLLPSSEDGVGSAGTKKTGAAEGEDSETAMRHFVPEGSGGDPVAGDDVPELRDSPDGETTLPVEPTPEPAEAAARAAAPLPTGRLAPGALGAMVTAHLLAHPEKDFSPTELSHVLDGRSSGAIYNALVKMVSAATVIQTSESPRRFRLAPGADVA